jgi:hypothetical protein
MQSRVFLPLISAAALFAVPALAAVAPYAKAKLAAPLASPKTEVIGGLQWSCTGDSCVANPKGSVASWSSMYACKKVSGSFGALASYSSRGLTMSSSDVSVCNKAAANPAPAQTAAQ